jgi:hypothetical protein
MRSPFQANIIDFNNISTKQGQLKACMVSQYWNLKDQHLAV